ncbi:dihydrofolate reductase family protein [Actinoplanes sp. NPDC051851]|uniref:dihydrofolate reductase family protein n=1 Tax=Actinoplanes sp. NPDC051851 TaxID=3154753 RepID=UPI0034163678
MGRLICTGITSLDGFIADEQGRFDWSTPSEEVHAFVNDLERPIGTHLLGRRLYEVMRFWENAHTRPGMSPAMLDFATLWRATDKIVYSTTLTSAGTERTRVERTFVPEEIRNLKLAADRDISVGGPDLARHAFRAGLVDEVRVFLSPVVVGGGTAFLPERIRCTLDLIEDERFTNGAVFLRYRVNT